MKTERHHMELEKQHLHQLELETEPQDETLSLPFLDDSLRWKAIYLFSGTVLLAAWWLIYDHLLAFSRLITYHVLPLHEGTHLGSTVEFFIFEVPKVLLLLTLIVFFVGVIRSFFTPERTRRILGRQSRIDRPRTCRASWGGDPFLFVLGGSALHGLSYCRSAVGSHLFVSCDCPNGE